MTYEDIFKKMDAIPTNRTRQDDLLDDLLDVEDGLSAHALGFINDLDNKRQQLGRLPLLSERQKTYLEDLWEKHT